MLVCGVAALIAAGRRRQHRPTGPGHRSASSSPSPSVALVLDAVDGRVARRTGTVHPLGARFDMETDAFLILVLSVHVAARPRLVGARHRRRPLPAAARSRPSPVGPWLRGQVPARRWRKAVAAYQGIVLTVAAARRPARAVAVAAVAAGLALLIVSFGTEVATLRRRSLPDGAECRGRRRLDDGVVARRRRRRRTMTAPVAPADVAPDVADVAVLAVPSRPHWRSCSCGSP